MNPEDPYQSPAADPKVELEEERKMKDIPNIAIAPVLDRQHVDRPGVVMLKAKVATVSDAPRDNQKTLWMKWTEMLPFIEH